MTPSKAIQTLISPRDRKRLPSTISDIARLSIDEMLDRGISLNNARQIHAAISLAKEIAEPQTRYRTIRIASPDTAKQYCMAEFRSLACHGVQEEFWIVTLDTKKQPINTHQITVGTLQNSLVHPREVFRPAIADAASAILLIHNHPSGDPTPSEADYSVTDRLMQASEIIGIPVIDHIVVAADKAVSIQEWKQGTRW